MTEPSGIEAAALRLADKLESIIKQMEHTGDWRLSEPETRTIMDASQFLAAVACRPAASCDLIDHSRVKEVMADGKGFWKSCCGCHETNEGYPTGRRSISLKCHLGLGCSECGGIGAVWDDTDYSGYGDAIAASGDLRGRVVQVLRDVDFKVGSPNYFQVADAILATLPGRDEEAIRSNERERCAQVAADCASDFAAGSLIDPSVHIAKKVARHTEAAIRSLKTGSGE